MPAHKCTQERIIKYLIGGVLTLFVLYAGIYVYASETYATKKFAEKTEKKLDVIQQDIQKTMIEILQEVKK